MLSLLRAGFAAALTAACLAVACTCAAAANTAARSTYRSAKANLGATANDIANTSFQCFGTAVFVSALCNVLLQCETSQRILAGGRGFREIE